MHGLMQDWSLLMHRIIDHAAIQHGTRAVISRSVEGAIHRTNYGEIRTRALRLAQRLAHHGIRPGDRVATLAWNTWRHLEAWYGITGAGAIYHTVNPRLFPDQIRWIVTDAADRIMMVDLTFVPLLEKLQEQMPCVERFIILTDEAHMPATTLRNAVAYEAWLDEADGDFVWVDVEENTAAGLCYTSGTTGNPKGVLYSHRSNVLHAMIALGGDCLNVKGRDTILPVVPMFHANCWSLAHSAPMAGSALVMPGPRLDGASVHDLIVSEGVTLAAGVPTVWLGLLNHLDATGTTLGKLERTVIGGSACPRAMIVAFKERYGVDVIHAWGMTEMSPLGSVCSLKFEVADLTGDAYFDLMAKQGYAPFGVEMKIVDDSGQRLPWDGKRFGKLLVKGPAVAKAYYKDGAANILDLDGFFDTGDVATIDTHGYMQITDRAKDVIKSGGEWISSIDLENIAVGHPDVREAAVIGVPHPKWDERPLLVLVPKQKGMLDKVSVLHFMSDKIAKWWMPDDVQVVDDIPHTATGKIDKVTLRKRLEGYRLPGL